MARYLVPSNGIIGLYNIPIPSMYDIFTCIYHKNQLITNVGKYNLPYMEGMGYKPLETFFWHLKIEQDGKGQIPKLGKHHFLVSSR